MKKYLNPNLIARLLLVSLCIFVLFSLLPATIVGGIVLAVAAPGVIVSDDPVTVLGVDELVPGLNLKDIDKEVCIHNPSRFPLDTIIREIKKSSPCNSFIKKYYRVASAALFDAIDDTASGNGTTSSVPAKEYTYASGDGLSKMWIAITDSTLWQKDDTFVMRDIAISPTEVVAASSLTSTSDIVFYVHKMENSAIEVSPLNGIKGLNTKSAIYCMPNFTSAVVLYRLAPAKDELAAKTSPFQIIPEPDENYCQYFMRMVQMSNFNKDQAKEVQWDLADYEKMMSLQIRAEIECAYWWGKKSIITNVEDNTKRYTLDGIAWSVPNTSEFGTGGSDRTISTRNLTDLFKMAFVGNSGSSRKTMFAGSNVVQAMMEYQLANKTYIKSDTKEEWGIQFKQWTTEFGFMDVIHAPLFSEMGWANKSVLVDLEYLNKASRLQMQRKELDFAATGESNSIGVIMKECSTVYLQYPESHCFFNKKA
jgi:hypothetical protein